MRIRELLIKFAIPSTSLLVSILVVFVVVFAFFDNSKNANDSFNYLLSIFYQSEFFAFLGLFSVVILLSRVIKSLNFFHFIIVIFENRKFKIKGWPTKAEQTMLESLFYSGITFDELYQFLHFVSNASFIAFTESGSIPFQYCTFLARNEEEGYWLSYFRFIQRDQTRVKMLYSIISHFTEVLTGDPIYKKELKEQAKTDLELQSMDTDKLLIAILNKEDIVKMNSICDKYYKMTIEARVEHKITK